MSSNPPGDREQNTRRQPVRKPSLCVINYNGEQYLEACLSSVYLERADLEEILLVDNGSRDRSLELVASRFPAIRVIALAENLGPAAARNVGVREAKADLVLLLDNDVSLDSGCVRELAEALLSTERVAVAMPTILYKDDPGLIQYDGAESHFLGLMTLHNENVPSDQVESQRREIGSVISACVLVDRSRYSSRNLFDESFFIYHEDHEFGYRTRTLGWRILAVPTARCFHGAGTPTLSIRSLGHYSRGRVFYLIRNRWLFILRDYSLRTLMVLAPVLCLYETAQLALALKKGWVGAWLRAAGSAIYRLPETLGRRRLIQRERRRSDADLLTGGPIPFRAELTSSRLEMWAKRTLDDLTAVYWRAVEGWL